MKRSVRYTALSFALLTGSFAHARERPNYSAYFKAAPATGAHVADVAGAAQTGLSAPTVASTDPQRGVPTFVWAPSGQARAPERLGGKPEAAARWYLEQYARLYDLSPQALETVVVREVHDTGRGGIIVRLGQDVDGIRVFQTEAKVLMKRDLALVAIAGNLHASAVAAPPGAGSLRARSAKSRAFALTPAQALLRALHDVQGVDLKPSDLAERPEPKGGYRLFDLADTPQVAIAKLHLAQPARVRKVLFPLPDRVVPGYFVEAIGGDRDSTESAAYAHVLAADDGRVLYRENLSHAAAFNYRVWAETENGNIPLDGPLADYTPHPTGVPNGYFPGFIAPNLISMNGFNKGASGAADPWLPDGATSTRGNNVDAYADLRSPDGFSSGDIRADITGPNTFDRTYDTSAGPLATPDQSKASVAQIFYVTNWLHDWYYDSGFTEAAGNAQVDNFGRGGDGGDPLLAEAQDGAIRGSRDNANMDAAYDGASPRMQMYLWNGPDVRSLSAAPLNVNYGTNTASFGPTDYNLSGALALGADADAPAGDACTAITSDVSGKIALVDRGSCTFAKKAQNAQAAGAIGIVIANNVAGGGAPQLYGDVTDVTIPVQSVSLEDGNALKAAAARGPITLTLARQSSVERDGTIDNTIVAHEWGHYIHLRQVSCGTAMCGAESEGWGDFIALSMVIRDGDDLDGVFPLSGYGSAALGDSYFGIRRAPYSVDFTKNGLTFRHIEQGQELPDIPLNEAAPDNAEAHNAGEVWASMLFEAYIGLLRQTQGASPTQSFQEMKRRMSDYIVAGMKLAPSNPSYTEQRDAILAAALANSKEDFLTLAQGFARRGAGTCAVSPAADSTDFQGVVESFEVQPELGFVGAQLDDSARSCDSDGRLDAGESGKLTVEIANRGTAPLTDATAEITTTTPGVTFPNGAKVTFGSLDPFATGTATVDVKLDGSVKPSEDLALTLNLKSAETCTPTKAEAVVRRVNFDELPEASAVDDVEAESTAWTVDGVAADLVWTRGQGESGANRVWRAVDFASISDTAIESPDLLVSQTESFVLSFSHRHQFESSDGVFWDGAVVEITTNGGQQWLDITRVGEPGYGGTIGNQADNPLSNRSGYVDKNASWPAADKVSIDMGTKLAGQTVRVRFRVGSDQAAGEFGWELDDIGFKGITNTPFPVVVENKTTCDGAPDTTPDPDQDGDTPDARGPLKIDGGCGCVAAGSTPLAPLAPVGSLAALAALAFRRRRSRRG